MPSPELISRARLLVNDGLLPDTPATKTFGGHSTGTSCALCGSQIERGRVEIVLSWAPRDEERELTFHPLCHSAWLVALAPSRQVG